LCFATGGTAGVFFFGLAGAAFGFGFASGFCSEASGIVITDFRNPLDVAEATGAFGAA
jgi:hypothetical protein